MDEMFGDIFNWKLHSLPDYLLVIIILAVGALGLYVYVKLLKSRRNDKVAGRRVHRRLCRLAGSGAKVYRNVTVSVGNSALHFDHLVIDGAGILIARSFGWGLFVHGQARSETWKVSDTKRSEVIPNPVLALEESFEPLHRLLAEHGIYQVPIRPMAIFADNFDRPSLFLGRDADAVAFEGLKELFAVRRARSALSDIAAVAAVLESAMVSR